jgi:hypothetical protein
LPAAVNKKDKKETKKEKEEKADKKEKPAEEKADKKEKPATLPKRLALTALSAKYGWRLTGPNVAQLKHMKTKLMTNFKRASLPKIVLPHCGDKPYVCPDGLLPNPVTPLFFPAPSCKTQPRTG